MFYGGEVDRVSGRRARHFARGRAQLVERFRRHRSALVDGERVAEAGAEFFAERGAVFLLDDELQQDAVDQSERVDGLRALYGR